MDWIAEACCTNPPAPGFDEVRLPGQRAMVLKRAALAEGVPLYPGILPALTPWAEKLKVAVPSAL
jgi:LDH2 family malate/lactate/ureidoglycolate dehydrogenase